MGIGVCVVIAIVISKMVRRISMRMQKLHGLVKLAGSSYRLAYGWFE